MMSDYGVEYDDAYAQERSRLVREKAKQDAQRYFEQKERERLYHTFTTPSKNTSAKVVCLLSGGLDSTVLLGMTQDSGYEPIALSIIYGQRHVREIQAAREVARFYKVPHHIVDLGDSLKPVLKGSALTDDIEVPEGHYAADNMRITVVPNRNAILLSIATALAVSQGAGAVRFGAHAGDHCLPGSTIIWTQRGPVPISEVETSDSVASFWNGRMVWRRVIQKVRRGHPSVVKTIKTGAGELRCTSEHKVAVVVRSNFTQHQGWQKTLTWKRAGDVVQGDFMLLPAGRLPISRQSSPTVDLSTKLSGVGNIKVTSGQLRAGNGNRVNRFVSFDDYARLVSWFVTEGNGANGNVSGTATPNRFGVNIAQSERVNPENLREIVETAKKWGFNPSIYRTKRGDASVWFSGASGAFLRSLGTNSYEKLLPDDLLVASDEESERILATLIRGDGYVGRKGRLQYISTSRRLLQQVAYLGGRLGYRPSLRRMYAEGCFNLDLSPRNALRPNQDRFNEAGMTEVTQVTELSNEEAVYDIGVEQTHCYFAGDVVPHLVSNSIYPDCREDFVIPFSRAMQMGNEPPVIVEGPFLHVSKTDIVRTGYDLGAPFHLTWSCYKGGEKHCSKCGTCVERREAFSLAGVTDPTEYEASA